MKDLVRFKENLNVHVSCFIDPFLKVAIVDSTSSSIDIDFVKKMSPLKSGEKRTFMHYYSFEWKIHRPLVDLSFKA